MLTIFKGKAYGSANVGDRGQIVIPAHLRKDLNIKPGDQVMIFAEADKKVVSMMNLRDFGELLSNAEKVITRLEGNIPRKAV